MFYNTKQTYFLQFCSFVVHRTNATKLNYFYLRINYKVIKPA